MSNNLNAGNSISINCQGGEKVGVLSILPPGNLFRYVIIVTDKDDRCRKVADVINSNYFIHPDSFIGVDKGRVRIKPSMISDNVNRIRVYCMPQLLADIPFTILLTEGRKKLGQWSYKVPEFDRLAFNQRIVQVFELNRESEGWGLGCLFNQEDKGTLSSLMERFV